MVKDKEQPGMMLYWETLEALMFLPGEELKNMLQGMENYVKRDEEPELSDTGRVLWPIIRQRLRNDRDRYQELRLTNQIKGLLSSFKTSYAFKNHLDPNSREDQYQYLLSKGIPPDIADHWLRSAAVS